MPSKSHYKKRKRINVVMEAAVHRTGVSKAKKLRLRGGFSEYVSALIMADRERVELLRAA